MSIMEHAIKAAERTPLPDAITRNAIRLLVARHDHWLSRPDRITTADFANRIARHPIALATAEANHQHYEIPAAFFELILGARRKYSCCYYETGNETLDDAEENALSLTCAHADLADGQTILELGCGWGSLSLWMAEKYPDATVMAVSNSATQGDYIREQADIAGYRNLDVVTADMNVFEIDRRFDRVVSIEMFEHMTNWRRLLSRILDWTTPDASMFLHVFSHTTAAYQFDHTDRTDWIAQHFFTGGIMPSHDLIAAYHDLVTVDRSWRWSGMHYKRTAQDWLARYDANSDAVDAILRQVYGEDWRLWKRRWRLFFLATQGLFGHDDGQSWGVSHYRLKRTDRS